MESEESLPIKERTTMKKYKNCLTKFVQKICFCPNLGRGRGGKDQFIFVQNKNVQN